MLTAGLPDKATKEVIAQASGIFLKQRSPTELSRCIREVTDGHSWIDKSYAKPDNPEGEPALRASNKPRFTQRERGVLKGVFEGLASKEIGARLDTSETAVKSVLQQLFDKTGVRTRTQLVRLAIEHYSDLK
jgi:two-component system, NarL family, nitrate/nitrite response regulator NarL